MFMKSMISGDYSTESIKIGIRSGMSEIGHQHAMNDIEVSPLSDQVGGVLSSDSETAAISTPQAKRTIDQILREAGMSHVHQPSDAIARDGPR